jgi:hypothetical protein
MPIFAFFGYRKLMQNGAQINDIAMTVARAQGAFA